jgi:hypothetical protein
MLSDRPSGEDIYQSGSYAVPRNARALQQAILRQGFSAVQRMESLLSLLFASAAICQAPGFVHVSPCLVVTLLTNLLGAQAAQGLIW